MQSALNHFWGVKAKPARNGVLVFLGVRLLSLSMVLHKLYSPLHLKLPLPKNKPFAVSPTPKRLRRGIP